MPLTFQPATRRSPMLSLERCREILGPTVSLTDVELLELRSQLYMLAQIVVDCVEQEQHPAAA